MESQHWDRGSSLVVKPDVIDPITGRDLGERQGRLMALSPQDELSIQWDSITLKHLSPEEILSLEAIGLPWSATRLTVQEVLPTTARDREEDVAATRAALEWQYSWLSLGEQGRRIRAIVNREEPRNFLTSLHIWHAYLEEHLVVPFTATVIQYQRFPVQQGDQVTVTGICLLDETSGTIVRIRQHRRVYYLPLRDLQATNAPAESVQLIEDYAVWFGRHPWIYA